MQMMVCLQDLYIGLRLLNDYGFTVSNLQMESVVCVQTGDKKQLFLIRKSAGIVAGEGSPIPIMQRMKRTI